MGARRGGQLYTIVHHCLYFARLKTIQNKPMQILPDNIKMIFRIICIMLTLCYNAVITVLDCTNFAKV